MSRLERDIQKRDRAVRRKAGRGKEKRRVVPRYDRQGRVITYEKKRRDKKLAAILILFTVMLGFLYLPGLFMRDPGMPEAAVQMNPDAVRQSAEAVRSHTEDDFDRDGLPNAEEEKHGTNLWEADSDGDGAFDIYEINVSKTDPLVFDRDLLADIQIREDEAGDRKEDTPYTIGDVILWADSYQSKAHGSVVKIQNGYRFCHFSGYAQFPEELGSYAYAKKDGVRTLLPHRKVENAWKIDARNTLTVEIYENRLEEITEFRFFSKVRYVRRNPLVRLLSAILPEKGFITARGKTRADILPDITDDVKTEITLPEYDPSDLSRFTKNDTSLQDLQAVYQRVGTEGKCLGISLFCEENGEYLGIIYGYTADGDLLVADPDSMQAAGRIDITEKSRKVADEKGDLVTLSYYDFDGMGFHSSKGDRISFLFAEPAASEDSGSEPS